MINFGILLLFIIFFVADIVTNIQDGVAIEHIWHEAILCLIAVLSLAWQIREILLTKKSWQEWKDKTRSSAFEIRQQIDRQFGQWQLSNSEKDVALLLIKGLSMKEIADIRNTHEKTVRLQATGIYKKSGLAGRQELAAFFLEDILSTPV